MQWQIISALGFLHTRTNLSPFTKDFRGGDQLDEYLNDFSQVCIAGRLYRMKWKTEQLSQVRTNWRVKIYCPLYILPFTNEMKLLVQHSSIV